MMGRVWWLVRVAGLLIAGLAVTGCRPPATPVPLPTQPPSPTTLRVVHVAASFTPTPAPTALTDMTTTPAPTLEASPTARPTAAPCPAETGPAIRYDINAVVNLSMYTVRATEVVRFRNETGAALDELVFSVEPNRQPGVFSLIDLAGDAGKLSYELTGPRLTVALPEPLGGNCVATLQLDFVLAPLPIPSAGIRGRADHLGFSERQLNMGHWLPAITTYRPGNGWALHAAYGAGEHFVLPTAQFNVEITVEDAETPQVVGPGVVTKLDDDTWHFTSTGGRDIPFSISQTYAQVADRTETGLRVEIYYYDTGEASQQAAQHALEVGLGAAARYEELFGPPPFDRLVVVTSDFPDGMEFSGLVFVGAEYFRYYSGSPAAWLTLITAHELSHQWWYALVGNDQALDPWLDEMLATYSEVLYLEAAYPDLVNWWWEFRVASYSPQGALGRPIYDYTSRREYINVNYLRGAMMLRDLRAAMGDTAFLTWLRDYAAANAGRVAEPADLWAALPPGVDRAALDAIRRAYGLGEPN
ncbi:MAG: hypothetical protein JXB47_14715 [Anaerolineae bacterium]|nr:hypothetical protein [Anaerolineae bacterium]